MYAMKLKIYIFTILFCTGLGLSAQEVIQPKQLDDASKGLIYNKEFAIGLRLHTNGLAAGLVFGKIKTYYLTKYFHVELGEMKHPKEIRQSFDAPSTLSGRISRAFKYGKQNNLYALRAGIGRKRYFSEKAKHKGVAVGVSYELGPTLGLLKPYYLELRSEGGNSVSTKYSEKDANRFLDLTQIHGSSGWSKGLTEISLLPGAHGRAAVHFDWGAFDEYLKSVEAGIMVDVFTKKAPILVEREGVENNQLFLNLFIHLQFGKRR